VPTVAGEMKRHLRDRAATVRLPRRLHEASVRLPRARAALTARLGRPPTVDELAAEIGITGDEVAELETSVARAANDATDERGAKALDASEARVALSGAFRTLDDTDRKILYLRFVEERSRRQVATELGMSQGALARRAEGALAKLRTELEGRAFEDTQAVTRPESLPNGAVEPAPATPTATTTAKERSGHSGRLMLRMPQSLHADLAEAAEREEVSLNQFITNALSAAVGWHTEGGELPAASQAPEPPRWLPAALVTNIIVIVIAGAVALALLVIALTQGL